MTNSKMSLWSLVSKMPAEEFAGLYEEFPYKLRCLLGDWLESHPWDFIDNSSDSFCAVLAARLLSEMVEKLQDQVKKTCPSGPVLQLIASIESMYRREPLQLVEVVKRILQGERAAIQQQFQHLHLFINCQQEELLFGFSLQRLQYHLQMIQVLRENLMQMNGSPSGEDMEGNNWEGWKDGTMTKAWKTLDDFRVQQYLLNIKDNCGIGGPNPVAWYSEKH